MNMKYRIFSSFLLLLLFGSEALYAEKAVPRAPVVLAITRPSKSTDDLQLQKVISDAILLELERAGMQVIPPSQAKESPLWAGFDEGPDIDIGKTFDLAMSLGADYVLFCIYSRYINEIRLDCAFNDVRKRSLAVLVSKSRRIGLTLDVIVTESVQEIVAKMGARLTDLPPRETEAEVKEVAEREIAESLPVTKEESVIERGGEQAAARQMPTKRFELSVGFAPFLVVGDASDFFKFGLSPSFNASYWLSFPFGHIGLGLYTAIHLFQVEEAKSSSRSYLLPVGLDVRYETRHLEPLSLYVRASGGPSILTLSLDERGPLSKLIYYVLGGIGMNVPFTRNIGFSIDSSYIMFIGEENLIMGFSPSANLLLRF